MLHEFDTDNNSRPRNSRNTDESDSRRAYLVALGTHGDILPFIALGVQLKHRGFSVTLATPAPFCKLVRSAGLKAVQIGSAADFEKFVAEPYLWHPWRGVKAAIRFMSEMTEPVYRWLAQNARPHDIVVSSTLCLGARVAQDKFGLRLVTIHVMPFLLESEHAPPILPAFPLPRWFTPRFRHWIGRGADKYVLNPAALPRLNAFRAELGLPPAKRIRHWWHLASRLILMFPDWYVHPQPDWPANARQVGFPMADQLGDTAELDQGLRRFLEDGPPPLVFTYGSGMRQARSFFETAVAICTRLQRRGVFLAPQDRQVPADLPETIVHVPYAPLSKLLPHCAAIVHHGGIGTIAQALAAGSPQLIVPVAFNHFDDADRLKRLGLGMALSRRRYTARRASRLLRAMLADETLAAACAAARRTMMSEDGIGAACDEIEALYEMRA